MYKKMMDTAQMLRIWARISLLTQLGLSVVTPPLLLILFAIWLQNRFGVGDWVLLCAILMGISSGVTSVFSFVRREAAREARALAKNENNEVPDNSETEKETDHR